MHLGVEWLGEKATFCFYPLSSPRLVPECGRQLSSESWRVEAAWGAEPVHTGSWPRPVFSVVSSCWVILVAHGNAEMSTLRSEYNVLERRLRRQDCNSRTLRATCPHLAISPSGPAAAMVSAAKTDLGSRSV